MSNREKTDPQKSMRPDKHFSEKTASITLSLLRSERWNIEAGEGDIAET